jgi:hypothetical protein
VQSLRGNHTKGMWFLAHRTDLAKKGGEESPETKIRGDFMSRDKKWRKENKHGGAKIRGSL